MPVKDALGRWVREPVVTRLLRHMRVDANGCWVWTGNQANGGYSLINVDGKGTGAHRASYEYFVGPIPEGLQIDHLCRNRLCINPLHLEPVTPLENSLRRPIHHTLTCPKGHPYDEQNTYWRGNNRQCRACNRERWHRSGKSKRDALRKAAREATT